MGLPLEQTLIEVWRQALVESAKAVTLRSQSYAVRRTPKRGLRQVDFGFEGNENRGSNKIPRPSPGGPDGAVGQEGDAVP